MDTVVLSFELLCTAIQNDELTHVVRDYLRPKYGNLLTFESLVASAAYSVRLGIVSKLRETENHSSFCVHIHLDVVDACEIIVKNKVQKYADAPVWKGEKS